MTGAKLVYKFVRRRHVVIMTLLDAAGALIWFALRLIRPWSWAGRLRAMRQARLLDQPACDFEIDNLLLIRCDYIGDVLLTTHTLPAIRARFPGARISFLTSSRGAHLLADSPYVDEIITIDPPWFFPGQPTATWKNCLGVVRALRQQRFALALDFRGDLRNILLFMVAARVRLRVSFAASGGWYLLTRQVAYAHGCHEAEYHTQAARAIGAQVREDALPRLFLTAPQRAAATAFLARHALSEAPLLVAIHPGARTPNRRWPLERYAEVGRALIARAGASVLLIGAQAELSMLRDLRDKLNGQAVLSQPEIGSLKELTAILEHCQLYIGVSSGPSHLAASVGVATVLLFGPELRNQWQPLGNRSHIIQHVLPCCPCRQVDCPDIENNCIMRITADEVIEAALDIIGTPP